MTLDMARETRIAHKDAEAFNMDKKLYELEVKRTKNLGNMTSALLMLASSMDALTMFCVQPTTLWVWVVLFVMLFAYVYLCAWNSVYVLDSPASPPLPSSPPTMLSRHSQGPLA